MQRSALDRFELELRRWVSSHNETKGFKSNADELLIALRQRIGEESLARIGSAYLNGWLVTENEPGRGYFVREADRPGIRGGQFTIINRGDGQADPCWELFVQLGDYGWLRTVAQRHGQAVRLEDRLMDLTVRTQNQLVLYVEHKRTRQFAEKLLRDMTRYDETGFSIDDEDKDNDPLRKAKYMVRDDASARPIYFGLSAVGYRSMFKIEYGEGNRFVLVPDARLFSGPLADYPGDPSISISRSPVDPVAVEIERLCPNVWISVGSGQTAFN